MRAVPLLLALLADPVPDRRGETIPDRDVDVLHLSLDLDLDPAGHVEGSVTHAVSALQRGLTRLRLDAVGLDVLGVDVDGAPTEFVVGPHWLDVELPAPRGAGDRFAIRVRYRATPRTGLHFRGPGPLSPDRDVEVFSQGEAIDNRHWFPGFDTPSDRFTYEGRFTAPADLHVVSNGTLVERVVGTDRTTWTYRLEPGDLVNYLVMVAAAPYHVVSLPGGEGRPAVEVLTHAGAPRPFAEHFAGRTASMFEFFADLTGVSYPWPVYRQVLVQRFVYTGMENTTSTVLDERVLHDPAEGRFHRGAEDVVAHELAHHWFGDLVTCRSWRDLWVNEGITTFAAMAWAREARGEDAWADAWYGRVRGLAGRKDARPLVTDFFTRDGDRENADVYTKGAAVMQMLLVLLGEEAFRRGLHAYVEKHSYSLVHTSDLQRAFEDATGASLSWFFDQWAYLAGAPILRVAAAPDGAGLRVSIAQTQAVSGLVPRFTLPVDLEIGTDRSVRRERVWVDGHDAVVARIPLDGRLRWLAVDPDGGLVATIEQEQGEAAWIAQAASSPSAYARRVAMAALAERKGPPTAEARAFVTGRFRDEGAPEAVRTVAASVLGAFRDDGAREELLAMAPTVSPQLRAAIVDALAGFPPASASTRWLLEVARADASEHVRAAAVVALSAAMGRDALPSARLALRDRGVEGAVRIAAADLLGRWGDEGDVRLLAPLRGGTTEHGVRVAALWASVRIVARGRDADVRERLGESVADDAVAMLGDLHLRARQTAVAVLTELAQPRTEAALLASKTREREPALLTAIDAAVTAVRSMKAAPAEAPSETEARLRALEERFDALRKDFEEAASRR